MPRITKISINNSARTTRAQLNSNLWQRTSIADQVEVKRIVSSLQYGDPQLNGRSMLYQLQNPIILDDGTTILSLRFKGIAPHVQEDGTIPEHQGSGYVPNHRQVREDGTVYIKELNRGSPEGGMTFPNAETEFKNASSLGPKLADFAYGYGEYPDLEHLGKTLGFMVYGQEDLKDLRLWNNFLYLDYIESHLRLTQHISSAENENLCYLFGQAMKKFHQFFVHQFPHQGNIGIITAQRGAKEIRVRDLDGCMNKHSLTPQRHLAYLTLDLARIIGDFCANKKGDDGERFFDYNLSELLPGFLEGYFGKLRPFRINSNFHFKKSYGNPLTELEEAAFYVLRLQSRLDAREEIRLAEELQTSPIPFLLFLHEQLSQTAGAI